MRTSITRSAALAAFVASLLIAAPVADAGRVVTQTEERAFVSLWLLSEYAQQRRAHRDVAQNHDVVAVPVFDDEALRDADVVYVSPSLDLALTEAELDALVAYVARGGRLVIPGDNGKWAVELRPIADRFAVVYGESFHPGLVEAVPPSPDDPITAGPAGVVLSYTGASANNELSSTNEDFDVLAAWTDGPNALGYIEHGRGEVVFLADFNTFDDDMVDQNDNWTLWRNIFERPPCSGDVDGSRDVGFGDLVRVLANWGPYEPCPPIRREDLDQSCDVGFDDLLEILENWGDCR